MQLLLGSEQYSIANQMLVLLLLHHQFNNDDLGGASRALIFYRTSAYAAFLISVTPL